MRHFIKMELRNIARVLVCNQKSDKILLVRNKGANFWYLPGGGWEYEKETITECAKREVKEETGLDVEIIKFLYLQEFHESKAKIFFETFWLAKLVEDQELNEKHLDLDPFGMVQEVQWFDKNSLGDMKVFPKRLKDSFWKNLENIINSEDRFIGIN